MCTADALFFSDSVEPWDSKCAPWAENGQYAFRNFDGILTLPKSVGFRGSFHQTEDRLIWMLSNSRSPRSGPPLALVMCSRTTYPSATDERDQNGPSPQRASGPLMQGLGDVVSERCKRGMDQGRNNHPG